MPRHIGIDAIPVDLPHPESKYKSLHEFEKSGSDNLEEFKGFHGTLAIAVECNDIIKFYQEYTNALKKTLIEGAYADKTDNFDDMILCSKDFKTYTEGEIFLHESFLKNIKNFITNVYVVFSSFDVNKIPEVKIMGRTRHPQRVHPKILTLKYLHNTFPHICLWRMLPGLKDMKDTFVYMDHFDGKRTFAWETILTKNINLSVYYKGDECNPLISTADILLRCLQNRIETEKTEYHRDAIKTLFSEFEHTDKLKIYCVNDRHYTNITPRDERNIPLRNYIKRPVYYVISPLDKNLDFEFFLDKPKGKLFLRKVSKSRGCYKKFDKNEDKSTLKDNDYLVYLDVEGKDTAESIAKYSGLNLSIIEF